MTDNSWSNVFEAPQTNAEELSTLKVSPATGLSNSHSNDAVNVLVDSGSPNSTIPGYVTILDNHQLKQVIVLSLGHRA